MLSKFLLCDFNSNYLIEQIKRHYIDIHKVDEKNEFFINLFKSSKNVFCGRKCLRCDEVLPTTYFKKAHDFWYIIGQAGTFLRKILLTIVLLVRFGSIKLHLVNIQMIMIFIILRVWWMIFCSMLKIELKDLRVWWMSFCSMLKLELKDLTVISL